MDLILGSADPVIAGLAVAVMLVFAYLLATASKVR